MSIKSINLLPEIFRSEPNRKFLNATLDQLISEPNSIRLDSYIGRVNTPTWKEGDTYVAEPTTDRQQYQLESSTIVSDTGTGQIPFYSSYIDLLQQIAYYGGITNDHSRLFSNQSYSFNGLFDFDKFVNFTQYLWLPNGPPEVAVSALTTVTTLDFTVTRSTALQSYQITPYGNDRNPIITLTKGETYKFHVNQSDYPFWIQTEPGVTGSTSLEGDILKRSILGVTNNGATTGEIIFQVPLSSAQNDVLNAPLVATVDFATTKSYNEIQSHLTYVLAKKGGIDGVSTGLSGKTLIFLNQDFENDKWTDPGNFDIDGFDSSAFEAGATVAGVDRYSVFRINLVDVGGGRSVIRLNPVTSINYGEKVYVSGGATNSNVQFIKNQSGYFEVTAPVTAPLDTLYYQDDSDPTFIGVIRLLEPGTETIDVETDILGRVNYTSPNGITFTNGLQIRFDDTVIPARYQNNSYLIEGVGSGIKLLSVGDFTVSETYGVLSGLETPDYVTINRASRDLNAWSRSNRWFHRQTVEAAAAYRNEPELLKLTGIKRGTRPIIEFDPDIYLFDYGRQAKAPIDIIDFVVQDAFAEVEGKNEYIVRMPGGVTRKLTPGTRIIFAGDLDPDVRNRIYRVELIQSTAGKILHLASVSTFSLPTYEVSEVAITSNLAYNFVPTVTFSNPLPGISTRVATGNVVLHSTGVANVGVVYGGVNYIADPYINVTTTNTTPLTTSIVYKPFKQVDYIRIDAKGVGLGSSPVIRISNPNSYYANVANVASSTTFTLNNVSDPSGLQVGSLITGNGIIGGTYLSVVADNGNGTYTVQLNDGVVTANVGGEMQVANGDNWTFSPIATNKVANVAYNVTNGTLITVNSTAMIDTGMIVTGGARPINITNIVINVVPTRIITSTPHYLIGGELIYVRDVTGTVELNNNKYYASLVPGSLTAIDLYADPTFLAPQDSRGYTPYVSGGTLTAYTIDYGAVTVSSVLSDTEFETTVPVSVLAGTSLAFIGVTAQAIARSDGTSLYSISVTNPGSGYTNTNLPVVTFDSVGAVVPAQATSITNDKRINYIKVTDPGTGYEIKANIDIQAISHVDVVTSNVTAYGTSTLYFADPKSVLAVQPGWLAMLVVDSSGTPTYTDFGQIPYAETSTTGPNPAEYLFFMDVTKTRSSVLTVSSVGDDGSVSLSGAINGLDSDGVEIDLPAGSKIHFTAQNRFFTIDTDGSSGALQATVKTGFITARETIASNFVQLINVMGIQPGMMMQDLANGQKSGIIVTAVDGYVNTIYLSDPVTLAAGTPIEFKTDALLTTGLIPAYLNSITVTDPGQNYTSAPVVTIQPLVQSDAILASLDTTVSAGDILNVSTTKGIVVGAKATSTYDNAGHGLTTGSDTPVVMKLLQKQITSTTFQPQVQLSVPQPHAFTDIFVTFTYSADATANITLTNSAIDVLTGSAETYDVTDTVLVTIPTNKEQLANSATSTSYNQFYYDGSTWLPAQQKKTINQEPLFDIFDRNGYSAADSTVYTGTKFTGTKIFGYTVGTGASDSVLNFPLSYKNNFQNVGDIEFSNHFQNDSFVYLNGYAETAVPINSFVLKQSTGFGTYVYRNVWTPVVEKSKQYQTYTYVYTGDTNYFEIDVQPASSQSIPYLKVYVGQTRLSESQYSIQAYGGRIAVVIAVASLTVGQRIIISVYSKAQSKLAYYDVPSNLDQNPLNSNFASLTLGQVRSHLTAMTDNHYGVVGPVAGSNNIRDLFYKNWQGAVLQHTAPLTFASIFIVDPDLNVIESIKYAQREYTKFKNRFLSQATKVQVNVNDIPGSVDTIMASLMLGKSSMSSWYDSDMVPYGTKFRKVTTFPVLDARQRTYLIPDTFNPSVLQRRAVLVYLKDSTTGLNRQLITGIDVVFNTATSTITIADGIELTYTQQISIVDYTNTVENYIPETPTKLGLYPKFTPQIIEDNTYRSAITMIQGHDGSLTPAFGDYRDQLLLELETRIYNNIKVSYDNTLLDMFDTMPGRFRSSDYSRNEFNQLITQTFLTWIGSNQLDYSTNVYFESGDPFTWTYNQFVDSTGELLPGFWRGIFKYYYDTDRPHQTPWEMLGFSQMPDWWINAYGPAPYTGGNSVLWADLEAGRILSGPRAGIDTRFARPGLSKIIPVDENGNILPPINLMVANFDGTSTSADFVIGDHGPAETAWMRSSDYPYALQIALILARPGAYLGTLFDNSRYSYDADLGQITSTITRQRIEATTVAVPDAGLTGNPVVLSAGYGNWIRDALIAQGIDGSAKIRNYFTNLDVRLSYKAAGFTDKNMLEIVAQQSSPGGSGNNIVIPNENYVIHLNKSTPTSRLVYSAVIIEATNRGWKLSGYNQLHPYFNIIPSQPSNNAYSIEENNVSVTAYKDAQKVLQAIPYGTECTSYQQVADFLISYQRYLQSIGFLFDEYNGDLGGVQDWTLSIREFITWAQQGWKTGTVLVASPIGSKVTVATPRGVIDYLSNKSSNNRLLDQNFTLLRAGEYSITREDSVFTATSTTGRMIALADLSLVEYEHTIIFDNKTVFGDVIYQPEIGDRQYRLRVTGFKTSQWTGQLNAPGYVYNSDVVNTWEQNQTYPMGSLVTHKNQYYFALQNVPASTIFDLTYWKPIDKAQIKTGLLPNLSNNANKFRYFYDPDKMNRDENMQSYSNGLIGYRPRKFLSELGIETAAQVKFYQGYITQKGTENSITALTHGTFDNIDSSISVYEEWALRLGEYGSTQSNQYLEVTLNEQDFPQDPASFVLQNLDATPIAGAVNFDPRTIYRTSEKTYTPNIIKSRADYLPRISDNVTAGYPTLTDIDGTIFDISDYQSHADIISNLGAGYKIWVAVDFNKSWNVYRATETDILLNTVSRATTTNLKFTFSGPHQAKAGDLIAIKNFYDGGFDGFYIVLQVLDSLSFTVFGYKNANAFSQLREVTGAGIYYKMISVRYNKVSDIIDFTPPHGWRNEDRAWIDNDTATGIWGVFQKTTAWDFNQLLPLRRGEDRYQEGYGSQVKLSTDNQIIVTGTPGFTTGSLTGLKVINPGSGYSGSAYVVVDLPTGPSGIEAKFSVEVSSGTLRYANLTLAGDGYTIAPDVILTDTSTITVTQNPDVNNPNYIHVSHNDVLNVFLGDTVTGANLPSGYTVTVTPNTVGNYFVIKGPDLAIPSSTNLQIQTGSVQFTTSASASTFPGITTGQTLRAYPYGHADIYMEGTVTSFTGTSLVVNMISIQGSTTPYYNAWTLSTTPTVPNGSTLVLSRGGYGKILAKLQPTQIDHIKVANGGSGFILQPQLIIDDGGGYGATAEAVLTNGSITSVNITNPGNGYTDVPDVIVLSNNPAAVDLRATLKPTGVGSLVIDQTGTGYRAPAITISANVADFANSAIANLSFYSNGGISSVSVFDGGYGYGNGTVIYMANSLTGSGFVGTAYLGVKSARLTDAGTNYWTGNIITINGGSASNSRYANILVTGTTSTPGAIQSFRILSPGFYTGIPHAVGATGQVYNDATGASGAKFDLTFAVANVAITNPGSGYDIVNTVANIYYGGGSGATGTVTRTNNGIGTFTPATVTNYGQGYVSVPKVTVYDTTGSGAVVEAIMSTGQVKTFLQPDKTNYEIQETQLINPFSSDAREFGYAVDIGTLIAAAGAPGSYAGQGGVLISQTLGAEWISYQMLFPADLLTAVGEPRFGHSIAMSRDENWIYVGAPGVNKVYCYGLKTETYARVTITPAPGQLGYLTNLLGLQSAKEIVVIGADGKIFEPGFDYTVSSDGLVSFADYARISQESELYITRKRLQTTIIPTVILNEIYRSYTLLSRPSTIDQLLVYGASGRVFVPNKEFTIVGTNLIFLDDSFLTEASIVVQQKSVYYTLVDTITPPDKVNDNANFGWSVKADKLGYRIVVGAPDYAGTSTDATTWSNVTSTLTTTSTVIPLPNGSVDSSFIGTVVQGPGIPYMENRTGVLVTGIGTQNINGVVYSTVTLDTLVTVSSGDVLNFIPRISSSGRTYVFSRSYEVVLSVGTTNTFTFNSLRGVVSVSLDDIPLTNLVDFVVLNNSIQLASTPANGAKIRVDTNLFNLVQALAPPSVIDLGRYGYTVAISPDNKSMVVGSPGYRDVNYYNGTVYRYVNKGLFYGTITTDKNFLQTNVKLGDTIRINNKTVTFPRIQPGSFSNHTVQFTTTGTNYVSIESNVGVSVSDIFTTNTVSASSGIQVITVGNIYVSDGINYANVQLSSTYDAVAGESIVFERHGDNISIIKKSIDAAGIIGIQATVDSNNHVVIQASNSTASSIDILPGIGYALDGIGLNVYQLTQTLEHPRYGVPEKFGTQVSLDDTGLTLAIASEGGNTLKTSTFDKLLTLFDRDTTRFIDNLNESGAVYIYDYLSPPGETLDNPGKLLYNQVLQNAYVLTGDNFGSAIDINAGWAIVGANRSNYYSPQAGAVHLFINPTNTKGWSRLRQRTDKVDIDYINEGLLYSKSKQVSLQNLDYFDPAKGKILGIADKDLDYKSLYDPAIYNKGTRSTVNISTSSNWNSVQETQTWWDLSQARYIDYEQGDISYRSSHWGELFPGSTISVAEWVSSSVLPSEWNSIVGDGVAKYPDNSAYVEETYFDSQSGLIKTRYYFWVIGKRYYDTAKTHRTSSTVTLEAIIRDPKGQGIPYFAAISTNAFNVYNVREYLKSTDTVFRVDYSKVLNQILSHNEWKLIQEGNENSYVPTKIINKLVDSLAGENATGAVVPDLKLSAADAYGINNLPRQSMIINNLDATKVFVSFVNNVLAGLLITGNRNFVNLNKSEPVPVSGVGFYDATVDTYEQLQYIPAVNLVQGYKVLVKSDSNYYGVWTIYQYKVGAGFQMIRIQSYNTTRWWSYVNWYATGYDQYTNIDFIVNRYVDIFKLSLKTGNTVKVLNNSQGRYVVYYYDSTGALTPVIVENGTIQLSSALYDSTISGVGFDNAAFDQVGFSTTQAIEIRSLFQALIDDLFIDGDKQQTNNMFFALLNYILSEQVSIDWALKTSFITVKHQLRKLEQFPNYIIDNQTYYESYIQEVKPYRTQVREYVLDYNGLDVVPTGLSDFDLPTIYDSATKNFRVLDPNKPGDRLIIESTGRNDWLQNYTYRIQNIVLTNGGSGYLSAPRVIISGGGGTGATAHVTLGTPNAHGRASVVNISLDTHGNGYTSNPTVTFTGGGGTGASASIVMVQAPGTAITSSTLNKKIRSVYTTMKFDRIGYSSIVRRWKPYDLYHPGEIIVVPSVNLQTFANYSERALPSTIYVYKILKTLLGRNTIDQSLFSDSTIVQRQFGSDFENANDRLAAFLEPGSPDIASIYSSPNTIRLTPSVINDQVISLGKQWNAVKHSKYYPLQHPYQYAAVGDSTLIGLSHDGVNWDIRNYTDTSINCRDVFFYRNYTWIVVANRGTVISTNDGVNWTTETINEFFYNPSLTNPTGSVQLNAAQILDITGGAGVTTTYSDYVIVVGNNGLILANPYGHTQLKTDMVGWFNIAVENQSIVESYLTMLNVDRGTLTDVDGTTYKALLLGKSGYLIEDSTGYLVKSGLLFTAGINGAINVITYSALDDLMNGYVNGYNYKNGKAGNTSYPWQSLSVPSKVRGLGDSLSGEQITKLAVSGSDTNWIVAVGTGGTLLWNQFSVPIEIQPGRSTLDAATISKTVVDYGFNSFSNFRYFNTSDFVAPLTSTQLEGIDFSDITWDGSKFIAVGSNGYILWGTPGSLPDGYIDIYAQSPVMEVNTKRQQASWPAVTNGTSITITIPTSYIDGLAIESGMLCSATGIPVGAVVSGVAIGIVNVLVTVTFPTASVTAAQFQNVTFAYGVTSTIAQGTAITISNGTDTVVVHTSREIELGTTRIYVNDIDDLIQANWYVTGTGIPNNARVRGVGKFANFQWQLAPGVVENTNINYRAVTVNTTTVEIDTPLLQVGNLVPVLAANGSIVSYTAVTGVFAGNIVTAFDPTGNIVQVTVSQTINSNSTTLAFSTVSGLATGYILQGNATLGIQDNTVITSVGNYNIGGVTSRLAKDIPRNIPGTGYPGNQVLGQEYTDTQTDSLALDSNISSSYTDSLLGTRPEDITIDGGKFIDTYSSHAPEELVPGQLIDSLQMNVFTANVVNGLPDYGNVVAFKIFTDYKLPSTFYRLTNVNTTKLTANLSYSDTSISVEDVSGLLDTGSVWINAEKITYLGIDRVHNKLLDLRRGTLRTSVPAMHPVGSLVTDATSPQLMDQDVLTPITDNTVVSNGLGDSSTYLTSVTSAITQGKIWTQ